jgi:hypothetical protein
LSYVHGNAKGVIIIVRMINSNKMKQPREHHYVAQGYLKGFTFDEKKTELFVLNKQYGSVRKSSPKGTAYLFDFYTINTIDEKDSAEIEESLGKIETVSIPILLKIGLGNAITQSEHADAALYIAVQYGRTPYHRARIDEIGTVIVNSHIKSYLSKVVNDPKKYENLKADFHKEHIGIAFPSMGSLIEKLIKPGAMYKITSDNGTFTTQFLDNATPVGQGLLEQKWVVLHPPPGSSFITSDNPIALRSTRKLMPWEQLAIMLPGVQRYFPLTKYSCLLIIDGKPSDVIMHFRISVSKVRMINQLLTQQASKYVMADNDKLLRSMVRCIKTSVTP